MSPSPLSPPVVTPPRFRARRHLRLLRSASQPLAEANPPKDGSPFRSLEAFALTMVVGSLLAGWVAVSVAATGPLLASAQLLARATRDSDGL